MRTYGSFLGLDGEALVEEYGHRQEPVEDRYPEDEPLLLKAPGPGRPRLRFSGAVLAGLAIAALAGVVAVLGLTGGDGGERAGGEGGGGTQKGEASATVTSTVEPPPRPSEVSLELTSIDTVWVCLIDERGRALVDGVTLAPGERQGPFRARAFKVTAWQRRGGAGGGREDRPGPAASGAARLPDHSAGGAGARSRDATDLRVKDFGRVLGHARVRKSLDQQQIEPRTASCYPADA